MSRAFQCLLTVLYQHEVCKLTLSQPSLPTAGCQIYFRVYLLWLEEVAVEEVLPLQDVEVDVEVDVEAAVPQKLLL